MSHTSSAAGSAWTFTSADDAYRLQLVSPQVPTVGAHDVLIRVRATSLNYRDLIHLRNLAGRPVAGRVALSDGAGEIEAVGPMVTRWKVGDRVAGCFFPEWQSGPFQMAYHQQALGGTGPGMLARHVVLPETGVVAIPTGWTFADAATLPCAAVTAWSALFRCGQLQAGQTVLVLGTGGVSVFALQLAAAAGAKVIVTSSSDEKLARARELGAWECINYRQTPAWGRAVLDLTQRRGVDHVMEVGGPGTLSQSLEAVGAFGQIALIGVLTGFAAPDASLFPLVAKNARMQGIYVGSREDFVALNRFLEQQTLRPVIDRVFPFASAPSAFEYLESAAHLGKVVITVD